jgi:prepilin-type N-terminal cleavage/methylation domain-containing protein
MTRQANARHVGVDRLATKKKQSGFSLIELMIAITVLAIGMAGILPVLLMGMNSNTANRQDSQAVTLAQMVTDQIASRQASTDVVLQIQDCRPANIGGPQNLNINTAAGGAALFQPNAGGGLPGTIDFSQPIVAGYQMQYYACGNNDVATIDGSAVLYDIRWNIVAMPGNQMKIVTVAARRIRVTSGSQLQNLLYSSPASLRTIVGS